MVIRRENPKLIITRKKFFNKEVRLLWQKFLNAVW